MCADFSLPRDNEQETLANLASHTPFRQTVAARIFSLAMILLLLTIALACFLLFEVTRTRKIGSTIEYQELNPVTQGLQS